MHVLEDVRTRIALRFLDAVTTAPLRPRRRLGALLKAVWSPRSSNYDRAGSAMQLIDSVVPGAARSASRILRRTERLPFRSPDGEALGGEKRGGLKLELAGYGTGATVYALGRGSGRRALKVYRRSLARPPAGLLEVAAEYRVQYERIRAWYAGLPHLVPATEFLVLHGPILGLRAACGMQDWIVEDRVDLFEKLDDYARDGARNGTLDQAGELGRELRRFASRTLELWASEGLCIDLLGQDNIVIANEESGPRLRLLDTGILRLEGADDPRRARVEDRMRLLRVFLEHGADGAER